jgi:hypothetical protein
MNIRHILKDGTEVKDVTGHVIKAKEHSVLYEIINRINQNEEGQKNEAV